MAVSLESSDLLDLVFVADPRVSPGGEVLAAVISEVVAADGDEPPRYRSEVRLFDLAGTPLFASAPAHSDSKPRFSPDGSLLAYLSKASKELPPQLVLVSLDSGEREQITAEPGGVEAFDWHPQGRSISYLCRREPPDRQPPVSRTVDRLAYKLDGKGYLPLEAPRLRHLEFGGEPRDLLVPTGGYYFEELAWAPDGRALYLTGPKDRAEGDEDLRRLWRLDADDDEQRGLPGPHEILGPRHLSAPAPSPDGESLVVLAPAVEDNPSGPSALWLISSSRGEPRRLETEGDCSPATGGDSRYGDYPNRPLWTSDDSILVNINREGRSNLAYLDLAGGGVGPLDEGDSVVTAFHHAAGVIALVRESSENPGELYVIESGEAARRVTGFNDELMARSGFRRCSGAFSANDGPGRYWRLDPAEPRDDRAVVIQVHGGPHTNVGHGFYFEFQLLAARGYSVVYGNPRGSSSYGFEFATSILGAYGTVDADDILAFTEHALANHPAPAAPVHLTGGSYGGFMTNWLVTHSDRFRSAVTQRSICNFVSFYGTSDIGYHFSERELGGTPWADHERLWRQSPLRLAHRVTTPVLILHAEADYRCPPEQAQQFFVALKRAGGAETRLTLFPEESHELSRSGRPDRRVARLDAIVDWFGSHP